MSKYLFLCLSSVFLCMTQASYAGETGKNQSEINRYVQEEVFLYHFPAEVYQILEQKSLLDGKEKAFNATMPIGDRSEVDVVGSIQVKVELEEDGWPLAAIVIKTTEKENGRWAELHILFRDQQYFQGTSLDKNGDRTDKVANYKEAVEKTPGFTKIFKDFISKINGNNS